MVTSRRLQYFLRHCLRWMCVCALAAFGSGAWAAGSGARPDGASGPGIGWFTTNGQLDAVFVNIDGSLWYSNGGALTNHRQLISAREGDSGLFHPDCRCAAD